jgi:hypothetical protein
MFPMMIVAATISIQAMMQILFTLVIVALIFYVFWWFLGKANLVEPYATVARVLLALFALIIIVSILLGLIGEPIIQFSR